MTGAIIDLLSFICVHVQKIECVKDFWHKMGSYPSPDKDAEVIHHDWSHRHPRVPVKPTEPNGAKRLDCPDNAIHCPRHQEHVANYTDVDAYFHYCEKIGEGAVCKKKFVEYKPYYVKTQTWKSCLCQQHLLFDYMCEVRCSICSHHTLFLNECCLCLATS